MKRLFLITLLGSALLMYPLAQGTVEIRIQDKETARPIEGIAFQYGEQFGISDTRGIIRFHFEEGIEMVLSHIGYGQWLITEAGLREAMVSGILVREKLNVRIHPVSVIAVHASADHSEAFELKNHDNLYHDGGAILNQVPAISGIRKSGSYGFDPVLRGFKYDQLNVVMNGCQCASAACPNRMDPPSSQMAPNMTERIEILKGPYALRYGSAVGGTINYIPADLRLNPNPSVYGRYSAGYEINGEVLRTEGLLGFSGPNYDLGLYGSWSGGNDYRDGDGYAIPSGFKRGSFGANLGCQLNDRQMLRLSAIRNFARDAEFPALPMDLRKDDTWLLNLSHEIKYQTGRLGSWSSMVYSSWVDHLMDNHSKPLEPRTINAETLAGTENFGGRTEGTWRFENSILYTGADVRIETAKGSRTREFLMGPNAGRIVSDNAWQHSRISKTGLFSEYQLEKNPYKLILSGRIEVNASTALDPDADFISDNGNIENRQINPNFSIGLLRNISERIDLGLWMGHARRSGSLTERYINYFPVGLDPYEMLGNPQLKPEVNNQADLTLEWSASNARVNLDVFTAILQNYISSRIDTTLTPRLPMSPGVRRYYNLDQAFKSGFELNWIQKLLPGLQHQLGIAYTYGQDLERNEPLPEIAPLDLRCQLTGTTFKNKLRTEIGLRYVLKQSRISSEFGENPTPSFTRTDLKFSYQITPAVNLTAGVNNLFDIKYHEHLTRSVRDATRRPIYAPGRSFYFSVNLDWR